VLHIYDISSLKVNNLTLILLTWRKWWAPNNASKQQMGFNSGFKGLRTAQYMRERLKSEWNYTLGHHPSIFTERGTAAPRSSLSPTAPWQIVCFTLFTSPRLSSEKRHDNLLCAHWRWIVITPQAMQMLLSASRSRPVLPPAGRLCRPCRPCRPRVLPPHTQTYLRAWPQRFHFPFSVNWTPNSLFNHYLNKKVLSFFLGNCHKHLS